MAALQKIRSKGPLLIGVIALGLFAFIAGDAWKVIAPRQSQDVGEVNGKKISAQDFQTLFEEYSDAVKFSQGLSALTDEQNDAVKDQVWQAYVNNQLIENEAQKLGLTVSDEEVQDIINQGTAPILASTPFVNQTTGAFDKDMLNMFLVNYSSMNASTASPELAQQYQQIYRYWTFIEKTLRQNRLAEKYQALLTKSLLSNSVEAEKNFEARTTQTDFLMAALPYSTLLDSAIVVTDAEIKARYEKNKEQYRQLVETRDVRYIDVQVVASDADRAALETEMEEYTDQLKGEVADYTTFIRQSGSEQSFVDLYYTAKALPSDVVARLDSVKTGEVFGPYYNSADNTLNSFKKLEVVNMADSIQFRQIQVTGETQARAQQLADSIFTALKGGANFAELAQKYGQTGEPVWITSANYEGAQVDGDNLRYINAITTLPQNQLTNLNLSQANVILEVVGKKNVQPKYKVAVVKRPVEFSKETYNKAYNDFSEFVAANNTYEKMVANAEDAGYRLYTQGEVQNSDHTIGSIRNTKDALKWVFEAKAGDASSLYECGESDRLMQVGVARINKVGYRPLALVQDEIKRELIREKKGEQLLAKAAGASLDQLKAMEGAVSDTIKRVSFSTPAYVAAVGASETVLSADAAVAKTGVASAPLKGNAAVYVVQPYAQNKTNDNYDALVEKVMVQNNMVNIARQAFGNDLYLKANVKDSRYLFF
ncbi:MAG: SurA N-terminal domain-containing protein [Bacteroidaceae bacterium]|nr:SurA N-terminal domain-containing protein [Bacteroidaceae bacterium]MBR1541417.1 SurA N-terminal domain-containing protein [Bacteroidaceae bacterium]